MRGQVWRRLFVNVLISVPCCFSVSSFVGLCGHPIMCGDFAEQLFLVSRKREGTKHLIKLQSWPLMPWWPLLRVRVSDVSHVWSQVSETFPLPPATMLTCLQGSAWASKGPLPAEGRQVGCFLSGSMEGGTAHFSMEGLRNSGPVRIHCVAVTHPSHSAPLPEWLAP